MENNRYNDLLVKKDHSIIIVDDNVSVLKMCLKPLQQLLPFCSIEGFSVIDKYFYEYLGYSSVDLCILDSNISKDKNAITLSEEILGVEPNAIFLFISGYIEYNIDSFAHLKGRCIYDFMSKPFTIDSLIISVITLLNISTTYKLLNKEKSNIDNIRRYYIELVERDKAMIKNLEIDMKKTIMTDSFSCKK